LRKEHRNAEDTSPWKRVCFGELAKREVWVQIWAEAEHVSSESMAVVTACNDALKHLKT